VNRNEHSCAGNGGATISRISVSLGSSSLKRENY
jgi:hypothetical protein